MTDAARGDVDDDDDRADATAGERQLSVVGGVQAEGYSAPPNADGVAEMATDLGEEVEANEGKGVSSDPDDAAEKAPLSASASLSFGAATSGSTQCPSPHRSWTVVAGGAGRSEKKKGAKAIWHGGHGGGGRRGTAAARMITGRRSGPPGRSSTSRGDCRCDDFCVRWDAGGWRPLGGLPHREGLVRTAGAAALGNRRPGGAAGDSRVGENAPKVRGSSGGCPREGAAAIAWEIGGGGARRPASARGLLLVLLTDS